jgi:hypothetical protein
MGELRDRCKLMSETLTQDDTVELFKELRRVYSINQEMAAYIRRISGVTSGTWNVIPSAKLNKNIRPPTLKPRKLTDEAAFERIQDIIINNSVL